MSAALFLDRQSAYGSTNMQTELMYYLCNGQWSYARVSMSQKMMSNYESLELIFACRSLERHLATHALFHVNEIGTHVLDDKTHCFQTIILYCSVAWRWQSFFFSSAQCTHCCFFSSTRYLSPYSVFVLITLYGEWPDIILRQTISHNAPHQLWFLFR